ncbi:EF hand [Stieleria maiorica]|uniref:EF hand n=2 Tax=Stieleria maiorica TaxID=2795974 RepID=A0A5B9MA80_9BACT|nr:EF hand [Stieleria maiorica]
MHTFQFFLGCRNNCFGCRNNGWFAHIKVLVFCAAGFLVTPALPGQDDSSQSESVDPLSIKLLEMDLAATAKLFARHDLDDDGTLSKTECERLSWTGETIRPYDLNRSGDLQQVEVTVKLAVEREQAGIVQMDAILADRYTKRYDSNRDGKLQLRELEDNTFSDQIDSYDRNSDDELSPDELIRGLAFERKFRDELGIKGCDQGGAMGLINQGDADGDRQLAGDELDAVNLDSATMKFDRNNDESLSVSELAEYLADRRMQMGLTPSDQLLARNVIRRSDPDGDGLVPANLLRQSDSDLDLGSPDENGDGSLSLLEMETYLAKQRKRLGFDDEAAKRASILIARNDSDGDRKLSKAELVASGANRDSPLSPEKFTLIDQDSDAAIDMKELARFIQKTRRE